MARFLMSTALVKLTAIKLSYFESKQQLVLQNDVSSLVSGFY